MTQRRKIRNIILRIGIVFLFLLGPTSFSLAQSIPESAIFFVDQTFDRFDRTEAEGILIEEGRYGVFYVDKKYWLDLSAGERLELSSKIKDLSVNFDRRIYPELRGFYGPEPDLGPDGQSKVTIFLNELLGNVGGYFNPQDLYPKSEFPFSNEKKLVNLNTHFLGDRRQYAFLAHEFQHLITFNWKDARLKESDDVWLNEARSEYAPTYLGYDEPYGGSNLQYRVNQFRDDSVDSLLEWSGDQTDYGSISLFAQYVAGRYGPDFLKDTLASSRVGIEAVEFAMRQKGENRRFDELFIDWTLAMAINDRSIKNGRWSFSHPDLRDLSFNPTALYAVEPGVNISRIATIQEWIPLWYVLYSPQKEPVTLEIEARAEVPRGSMKLAVLKKLASDASDVQIYELNSQSQTFKIEGLGSLYDEIYIVPVYTSFIRFLDRSAKAGVLYLNTRATEAAQQPLPPEEVAEEPVQAEANLPDGSLVRAKGDYKVYVIKGRYKRHIPSPEVFKMYGHFKWAQVHEVSPKVLDGYITSRLVRAEGDARVYEVGLDGKKRWLDISASEFTASGRSWESIFVINTQERSYYLTGIPIKL